MELQIEAGTVLVDTLLDAMVLRDFFFLSFLLSALRLLISNLNFLILSERFSFSAQLFVFFFYSFISKA